MAAASVVVAARPSQALRQRRESHRSAQAKPSRAAPMENGEAPAREPSTKPYVRDSSYILKKFAGQPPSLVIHLHTTYFRLEHQEDTFPYDSPMKLLIQHLKDQTLPHDMLEELYEAGVPFYDGCLIVELHDHRSTGAAKPSRQTSKSNNGNKSFSIHNYNPFTTPSPYVPYPETKNGNDDANIKKEGDADAPEDTDAPGENDDSVDQATSLSQTKAQPPAKVYTIVLHPTGLSREADMRLLANTPMPDPQSARRQQSASRTAATPTMPHPPTPLTSVPPTPLLSTKSPKVQKMVIDGSNHYEFEAAMLLNTSPALFLEPTTNFDESIQLMDTLTHPNHKHSPPPPRKRKRTTAELAADEADAAAQQRFVLIGDDRKSSAVAADNDEGQGMRGGAAFEPRFSRFKTLETIKMQHEEKERRKKEDEARQAHIRKQMQAQQQAEREKREEEQARANEQERLMAQRREQARLRMSMAQAAQAQGMSNTGQFGQVAATNSQPQQASPVVRQQTPMAAPSPSVGSVTAASHPMAGVPMATTASSQGAAGSPPRPPSVMSHHGGQQIPMARQVSQQHQQVPSRNGTPQVMQGTPQMNSSVPINRNMTPQPTRMQQGSPVPGGMQGTPVMGQHQQLANQQMGGMAANLTPEQMAQLQRQRLHHAQAQRQAQAHMQAQGQMSGTMGASPHQMTPEQQQHLMMLRAQSQAGQQQQGMQNQAQQYQQQLARQMANQANSQSPQEVNGSPVPAQMRSGMQLQLQNMLRQYQETRSRIQQQFPNGMPQNAVVTLQSMEQKIRLTQQQLAGRQVQQPNMGGPSAVANAAGGMGQMPANIPPGMSQQQYMAMLQQRQQQQAHMRQQQQQQLMMRQMQQQGQNPQMNMGNMGMNMAGMPMGNMQGMQNMMGMQGNPQLGNMQGMMWMNQGQGRGQGMG